MKIQCEPCEELVFHCDDPLLPLTYDPKFDEYSIVRDGPSLQLIKFCPFCGGLLPKSRRDQFFDELESAGIEFQFGDDWSTLPERFQLPRWWDDPRQR